MQNIQNMFESATLKLTAWYLLGVMILSFGFSALVYNSTLNELQLRFGILETRLQEGSVAFSSRFNFDLVRERQMEEAKRNITTILVYTNLVILAVASIASYIWARRTLRPIEEAHEAQSRFTSDASHELRTPLSVMQAEIELALRDKRATKDTYRHVLESNHEEVIRLSQLSTMLLRLAQLDTQSLSWKEEALENLVTSAKKTFSAAQSKRIHVIPTKKSPKANVNQESIIELFIILLDNALKYSTPGSTIVVRTFREKGKKCCSITNEGVGIKSSDMSSIFRRFYQANTSRTKKPNSGYGLGLSLAKKIAELHHGEITVESTPHKTTTFTVKL